MPDLAVAMLDASGTPSVVFDREGRILLWNRACSRLLEFPFEEVRGRHPWDSLLAPEEVDRFRQAFASLRAGGQTIEIEGYWSTKSGARRWIAWSYKPSQGPDGSVDFVVGTGIDRTDAKVAEEALRVSEARFTGIVSIASDAIIVVDEEQRIVIYNEGAEAIFGWSRDEILGRSLDILIPERLRASHREHIRRFAREPARARRKAEGRPTILGLRKNGEEFPASGSISKLDVCGARYSVVLRDITDQARTERHQRFLAEAGAALAESLDYDETLAMIATLSVRFLAQCCIIELADEDGVVRRRKVAHSDPGKADLANALRTLALDPSEPYLSSEVIRSRRTLLVPEVTESHLRAIAQSEEHLHLLLDLAPASYLSLPLVSHGRWLGAMLLIRTVASQRWEPDDVRLGEELAYRAARSIESATLYQAAQRAIQLRDDILHVVAHDLRNPLSAAKLAVSMVALERPNDEVVRKTVGVVERSVGRAMRLIQDLLDVARTESGTLAIEPASVRPVDLARDVEQSLAPLASARSIELTVEGDFEALPEIRADASRILQVLSNLVGNAVKFTPAGGRIRVSAAPAVGGVCFSVADSGPGIAERDVQHLFDRFWQAQRADRRGIGMGLAIAKGIVEAHGGRIWVETVVGRGSTFHFTVPTVAVSDSQALAPARQTAP